MIPQIAVLSQVAFDGTEAYPFLTREMSDMIETLSVNWEIVPTTSPINDLPTLISRVDGIVIPGVTAKARLYYGNTDDLSIEHISGNGLPKYDKRTCSIIRAAHESKLPTLGICHGMQLMGLAFGGEWKYIDGHAHNWKELSHKINLSSDFRDFLSNGSKKDHSTFFVNSIHSMTLASVPDLFAIAARASDLNGRSVPEAIYDPSCPFFVGVQWHPEHLVDDLMTKSLLGKFKESVEHRLETRKHTKGII